MVLWAAMYLFYTDSVTLAYADVEGAKRWWVEAFDCRVARVPPDWDCQLQKMTEATGEGLSNPACSTSALAFKRIVGAS
jgi:hypothetical protein